MAQAEMTTASETPAPFKYDEDRHFFAPDDLAKAEGLAKQIADSGVRVITPDGDWPDGAGAMILPLARNEKTTQPTGKGGASEEVTKRNCYAVLLWPLWPLVAFNATEGGGDYLRDLVEADQAATVLNPLRRQRWEKGEFDVKGCALTLAAHVEGKAAERGVLKSFTEACKVFLPQLKDKWPRIFGTFTPGLLRNFLQDASVARQFSPELEAKGFFVGIIDKLEAIARKAGGNVEIFQRWRDTRNEAKELNIDEVNLSDLAS